MAPAQGGDHPNGRKTFGHSLIVGPWGEILAEGGEDPGIIAAELDLDEIGAVRARLPSLRHDRDFAGP
jgi:predicted amidohydrolase